MTTSEAITTDRLTLRPFRLEDAPIVQQLAGDARVGLEIPVIPHPYPDGAAETWIEQHQSWAEAGTEIIRAITETDSGDVVGSIGLARAGGPHCAELGYWLGVPYWGRGYVTEAARAFLNWAFDTTPVIRIQAHHRTVNLASGRVLQKIGMEREGLMRQRALVNDEPADIVYYSALKEKWPPSAPPEPQSLGLEAMPLTTDRLVLRPITMDDVEVMHQLWCSPGVFEGLASIPRQPDMAFARGRVANMYERIASGLCLNLLASLGSPEGEVIGEIGISVSWRHRKGELGYLLDERYRGQGYASEILQAMAEHAFGPMGLHRLQAGIYPENTASGRLLERHGFTPEGFTRGAFRKEGEYLDGLEWSLLVTDPRPWQGQAD